jgi:two-component system, OmpR family, response regulator
MADAPTEGVSIVTAPGMDEVLEVQLPAVSGDELRRRLEATGKATVILLLTADDAAEYQKVDAATGVSGDTGATVQPSSPVVLAARLSPQHHDVVAVPNLQVGPLRVDFVRTRAWVGTEPLSVTPRELLLLTYLAHCSGQVVSKTEILRYVWGESGRNPNLVEVAIGKLRRKLERSEEVSIITVRGVGYLLTF